MRILVGNTASEFGGSHFTMVTGEGADSPGPAPDAGAPERYRSLHQILRTGRVRSCHDLSEGGLAVALAEMCIGGRLGADIDTLPDPDLATSLFSESTGRFVCEVNPDDVVWFLDALSEPAVVLGDVILDSELRLLGIPSIRLEALQAAFKGGQP